MRFCEDCSECIDDQTEHHYLCTQCWLYREGLKYADSVSAPSIPAARVSVKEESKVNNQTEKNKRKRGTDEIEETEETF